MGSQKSNKLTIFDKTAARSFFLAAVFIVCEEYMSRGGGDLYATFIVGEGLAPYVVRDLIIWGIG